VEDRRTRHRQRRRDQVLSSAVELFTEQGYESTTMDEIAEHADVARATVFNHFSRKIEFVEEWGQRRRMLAVAAVEASGVHDRHIRDVLSQYVQELAKINNESRAESVALMGTAVHLTNVLADPPLGHVFAGYFATAQERGEVAADVDPGQAGLLLATAYFAVLTNWIRVEPAPFDLGRSLGEMLEIVLNGVLTRRDE
jgi:AcrR family transcriptional regulator